MPSISNCLAKAGDAISRADRTAILSLAKELRAQGIPNEKAGRQAVERILAETHAAIAKMKDDLGLNPKLAFSRKEDKPFYSALARGIEGINAKSQPAEGWRAQIQGLVNAGKVKADEVEWSGLNDWLKLKSGKVSKQEVQDFIAANGVQVHEVTKGAAPSMDEVRSRYMQAMVREGAKASEADQMFREMQNFAQDRDHDEALKDLGFGLVMKDGQNNGNEIHDAGQSGDTKYGQYVLPGGSNYRELLLTLPAPAPKHTYKVTSVGGPMGELPETMDFPTRAQAEAELRRRQDAKLPGQFHSLMEYEQKADREARGYRSSHWDEPNILSHIRLNDRTDADGKKTLFVEELQSDWAQEGRKKGFQGDPVAPLNEAQEKALRTHYAMLVRQKPNLFDDSAKTPGEMIAQMGLREANAVMEDEGLPLVEDSASDFVRQGRVPRAPFVDSTDKWLPLALKRIIKLAASEGYDKVAFVKGEQAAERFSLDKQFSTLRFEDNHAMGVGKADVEGPTRDGTLMGYDQHGREAIRRHVQDAEKELPDVIGKELAERLLNEPARSERTGGGNESRVRELRGDGLKVEAAGMRGFYDQIVPSALSKLLPKFGGGKLGESTIPVDKEGWRITPPTETVSGKWMVKSSDYNSKGLQFDTEAQARAALANKQAKSQQTSFDVTDAMREKTAGGVPMFSRKDKPEEPAKPATPNPSHGFHTREIQVDGQWRPIEDSSGRLIARGDFRSQQNFYRWFSDSAVKDKTARPQVVYHGTQRGGDAGFDSFNIRSGAFFSEDPSYASNWANMGIEQADGSYFPQDSTVMPVYLSIKKPFDADKMEGDPQVEFYKKGVVKLLQAQGYDGAFWTEQRGGKTYRNWVAFDAGQIKSSLGNVGTFDRESPDVRFARKGTDDAPSVSTKAVGDAWKRMVKEARDDLEGVLFNWKDGRLTKDGEPVIYPGRDGAYERGKYGGKSPLSKREFFDWLASDAPHDPSIAQDAEWTGQIERLRAMLPKPATRAGKEADPFAALNAFKRDMRGKYGNDWQAKATPEEMATNDRLAMESTGGEPRFARKGTTTATANLPASAPLGTWERSKSVVSDLIDEGLTRSGVYRFTSPMSEGSVRAKAIAQNFANAERQARAEWTRIQDVIAKDFPDKTVREKMWNAADQENEILSGRLSPGSTVGLASLTPRQRDVVEQLHAYGEELLQRAKVVGMFSGDGVPYWTPRMMVMLDANGDYVKPTEPGKKQTSGGDGRNVFTSSSNLKQRKYLTAADTEAAMNAKGGELVRDITTMPMAMARLERAVAGRELINQIKDLGKAAGLATVSSSMHDGFFTLDHPAFTTYQPRFEQDPATGKTVVQKDAHGDPILDLVPLYMSKEFEGPIKAILSNQDGTAYRAYMLLKSKAMSAIMFSPLIHNMVIFGRALGYDPTLVGTVGLYFRGNAAKQDEALVRTAIDAGLVPMGGNHAGMIDVTDIARGIGREGGLGDPNESWIAHGAKAIIGAVNKDAGAAAKRFVDKAGDIWHGKLLWDRVGDLQMGIFAHAYERLQSEGFDPKVAAVMAAHWGNRYAGAVGRENMGEYARKAANVLLFSRSFNAGNLGTIKDMLYGLPAGLRAKIEYEHGKAAAGQAFTEARKKAIGGFIADAALSLVALSFVQSAVDKLKKDKGWDEIFGGYMDRAGRMAEEVKRHPMTPKSYSPWQLSPTHDNEPGKQDRVDMGEIPGAGGRHEYMRLPTGKVVEDLLNWTQHPAETFSSKMSPLAKAAWQIVSNDKGFGVPVYDPDGSMAGFGMDVAKHLAKAQTPWDTIVTAWDKMQGRTTPIENAKLLGNMTGFSASQGHPQGPEAGVAAQVEERVKAQKLMAMEEVKRLLRYDKEDQAREKLEAVGLTPKEVNAVIKKIENPKEMTPAQRRKFNQHGTEEDQQRMERVTR